MAARFTCKRGSALRLNGKGVQAFEGTLRLRLISPREALQRGSTILSFEIR
jgi:hypothetical protein